MTSLIRGKLFLVLRTPQCSRGLILSGAASQAVPSGLQVVAAIAALLDALLDHLLHAPVIQISDSRMPSWRSTSALVQGSAGR